MNRKREIYEVINKHVNQKCRSRCYQHPPTLDKPDKLPCPAKLFISPTSFDYTQMLIDWWYPSSKTCSCCGHKVDKLPLDIREWTCSNCGTHHDRDINAAINIKNQGQLDCYDQLLDQFRSDGTVDRGSMIPMRLEKYASKTERSRTRALVGIGTDEDTRSLVVY